MTPQAAAFLAKGDKALREGRAMLEAGFNEAAGRSAYLAAFHAAQALVFERIGRVLKTHHGVGNEFLRLTKEEAGVDAPLRIFLSQAYNLKAIADYEIGPGSEISSDRAAEALETAILFISEVTSLIIAVKGA